MGASSAEIDQAIKDTRGELDQTLEVLERRAARRVRSYGKVAAGLAIGMAAVVVGVLVYRRRRERKVVNQLHRALSDVLSLPDAMTSKLKKRLPIKVVITEQGGDSRGGRTLTDMAGRIAPTLVGSAMGAVMARLRGTSNEVAAAE